MLGIYDKLILINVLAVEGKGWIRLKNSIQPLLAYLITCIITILSPASDGYNTIGWKLFIGQFFAIPVAIIVGLITFNVNKKRSYKKE